MFSLVSFPRFTSMRKWQTELNTFLIMEDLPTFTPQTLVFHRGTEEYEKHAYQYGTSSHEEGSMTPAVIIYPKTVQVFF